MCKYYMKKYLVAIYLAAVLFVAGAQCIHAQTVVKLGKAGSFGVLAGSGITNVSAETRIIGDVGSSPTPTVTGLTKSQVKGHLYLSANPATAKAQTDLTTAYNEVAGAPCGTDLTGVDLGGLTLVPGVYCFSSSAQLTGTLTLDAQGDPNSQWIFQIGSTLTTASSSAVIEINGGDGGGSGGGTPGPPQLPPWVQRERGCFVYWQIGSSATIGIGTNFEGNILALTSITLDGGIYHGKALARNGAVTMTAQQRINGGPCPAE
jgi:type VI secretion system secreted protein VgrG